MPGLADDVGPGTPAAYGSGQDSGVAWDDELFASIGEHYDDLFAGEVAQTEEQAEFIVRTLGLRPGQQVLDVCCGPGRHALALARRGIHVTAVDKNPALLAEARRRARALGLEVRWLQADVRNLPPLGPFSGAICLFASWGYLDDPLQDGQVLSAISQRLRPGGRLLLDVPSVPWLQAHPRGRTLAVAGGVAIREVHTYDPVDGILRAEWRIRRRGQGSRTTTLTCRIYPLPQLEAMLARAGLMLEAAFGGFDGVPLSSARPRCLLVVRRPVLPALGSGG